MSEHFHCLVWVDHEIAKIVSFNADQVMRSVVHRAHGHQHLHHKANASGNGHMGIDTGFLDRIARALQSAGAILVTGPASAKHELVHRIQQKHADLAKRISGVETLDHPTDGELVAFGRRFFRADDRMHSQEHRSQA
jgi:hypothetical protein